MASTPLIVFSGDESFLIDEQCRRLEKQCQGFSVEHFDQGSVLEDVLKCVQSPDLFASSRLVFWKKPFFLSRKLDEKQVVLFDHIQSALMGASTLLVLVYYGTLDRRLKMVKRLEKEAQCKTFVGFKEWEQAKLLGWIQNRVKCYQKTITQEALFAIEKAGGMNLMQLSMEIEKLILYAGRKSCIELDDVNAIVTGNAGSTYQLGEALVRADCKKALALIHALLFQKEDPLRLLGFLVSQFRFYLQVLFLVEQGKSVDSVAKICKKHPFYLKKLLDPMKKAYDVLSLKRILSYLADLDHQVKTGRMKGGMALEFAVCRLKG